MAIGADVIAYRPTPEFIAGDVVYFAQDVPQCDVYAADCRGAYNAVAVPEVLAIHDLPQVFYASGIFADQ